MTAPPAGTLALDLYQELAPVAFDDENQGWALLTLCAAACGMLQPMDDIAADTDDGPGWSQPLDIDRAPLSWLPWLGQFVGVQVDTALTDAQQRSQIRAEQGMARGTVPAIKAAAAKYLTGTQEVVVLERTPDADSYVVITYTSETPDPAIVEAACRDAKPLGMKMTYQVVDGQTWAQLIANYATWADVLAAYSTWQDVINDTP